MDERAMQGALVAALLVLGTGGAAAEGVAMPEPPGTGGALAARPTPLRPATDLDAGMARRIYDLATRNPEVLQQKIREVLVTYMANPDSLEMAFEMGTPLQTMAGRIPRIEVALRGSVIKKLRVDRGYIVLEDAVLDLPVLFQEGKFRFREKGHASFVFEVSEAAINSLLQEKGDKLKVKNARMRLEFGHLTFTGRLKVLFFNNHVTVHGRFVPRNGTEIHFDPGHLRLDFLPLPGFLVRILRDRINPVADLANFRFEMDVGAIETTKTRLLLSSSDLIPYVAASISDELAGTRQSARQWPPATHSRLLIARDDLPGAIQERVEGVLPDHLDASAR